MLNLSLEQVMQYAKDYKAVPVAKECLADMLTPLAFLDNVRRSSRNYFLLESIEGGEHWARYSFVGYDPVLRLKITDGNAEIISGAAVKYQENDPLGCIRHILEEYKAPQIDGLPNFTGGLVGTFGFDFMRYCEPDMRVNKESKAEFADVDLMLFDKLIAFDHLKQKIFLIVNVKTDNAAINYAKAEREIAAMEEMLLQPVQPKKPVKAKLGEFTSNQSREQYNKSVLRCKEYIKNGDAFQIVYAQKFSATYDQSLFSVYRYLRTTNPSQYMVFLHNDDMEIAGSSPETLVKVVGKKVISMPIAGTRRRGRTSEEDLAFEQELLADAKEIAEHNMLVDLGRNDVGRVCDFGSVKVSDYKAIKRFSHVMHITSKVTGQLSADKDALDELRAVLDSEQGRAAQLEILASDCLDYVDALMPYISDSKCVIYAGMWCPTSTNVVRVFVRNRKSWGYNVNDLSALADVFADEYYVAAAVGNAYRQGYANRARATYNYLAGHDIDWGLLNV